MAEPGWYDDPANPDHVVWWDGQAWQPQHSQPRPRPTRPKKKTKGAGTDWILVGAIVLLIAIGAIVIAVIGGSGTGSALGAGARKKAGDDDQGGGHDHDRPGVVDFPSDDDHRRACDLPSRYQQGKLLRGRGVLPDRRSGRDRPVRGG